MSRQKKSLDKVVHFLVDHLPFSDHERLRLLGHPERLEKTIHALARSMVKETKGVRFYLAADEDVLKMAREVTRRVLNTIDTKHDDKIRAIIGETKTTTSIEIRCRFISGREMAKIGGRRVKRKEIQGYFKKEGLRFPTAIEALLVGAKGHQRYDEDKDKEFIAVLQDFDQSIHLSLEPDYSEFGHDYWVIDWGGNDSWPVENRFLGVCLPTQ
ncbi:MAG TPA: hypothetical protein VFQ60_04205 [Patescibacteria group bacterium]|nr:hypothetical protein [Patescibacteria group bacterium]